VEYTKNNSIQTEEDREIQDKLDKAGKGLPAIDALLLKYVGFPVLKRLLSWDRGMELFEREGQRILHDVKGLDESVLFKKVLIPKTTGIEDNSRYYSPAMVLWHLIYVGETIRDGIISLSRKEQLDFVVKIENFKPFVDIGSNIVNDYEAFLEGYRSTIEENAGDRYIGNYHAHPWFGPLNPHQWVIMSAVHQVVHRRQLGNILKFGANNNV
jgi:hypothetical protein